MTETTDTNNNADQTEVTTSPATPKLAKTATITLTGPNETQLQLVAERTKDAARTYVITTDAAKKSTRGMTEPAASFEAAKKHTEKLAMQAVKLGWKRREARRGFTAKADDFNALPAPPAAPKAKK